MPTKITNPSIITNIADKNLVLQFTINSISLDNRLSS